MTEITHRLSAAPPTVFQNMLGYLIPWLHNIELVDIGAQSNTVDNLNSLKNSFANYTSSTVKPPLAGSGWGSPEATNMVLNNFMYLTIKVAFISFTLTFDHKLISGARI